MVKAIITIILLTLASIAFIFDASVLKSYLPKFLFDHEIQSLIHILIFFILYTFIKYKKFLVLFAIVIELSQIVIYYRSFEIIDILSNLAGCYIAQNIFNFEKK